ncbi:MAG: inositol monophosphatase, partial [Proteobacteria bacterium]|nr:inositol monophosphatase [Pseudomonadota bacterium]
GVSIAYAYNGEVLVGVVNCPFLNEIFTAVKGKGAFLNDKRISVGVCDELVTSLVATGFPYRRDNLAPIMKRANKVLENCQDLRRPGAASIDLCWVACGRIDAYYEDVLPWDIAAGALVVKEAGGVINFINGYPSSHPIPEDLYNVGLVASNNSIAPKLLDILKNI